MTEQEIVKIYSTVVEFHKKFLAEHGVKLPKLYDKQKRFTKDGLVLVYLAQGYPNTKKVTKEELTRFVRQYYPDVNDVQQARHLGAQKGWWIVAGGRDNVVLQVERGSYRLYTLEKPYPSFKQGHRFTRTGDWPQIKKSYGNRCATCGSEEGEPHIHWMGTKTKLQKSHMDPTKPLIAGNIIPQCQKCNRGDRNRWVYDDKGRVIKIANPTVVNACSKEIRLAIYRILYKEFRGLDPSKFENL